MKGFLASIKTFLSVKKNLLIAGLFVVIIVLGSVNILNQTSKLSMANYDQIQNNIDVDPNAVEGDQSKTQKEIQEDLNQKVAESMINISMNMNPAFKSGDAEGNLFIVNNQVNNYSQMVEIYRNDTQECIYKSGAIPVGSRIDSAKLNVALKKGVYDCTAYFNAIEQKTNSIIGKAGAKITITILS